MLFVVAILLAAFGKERPASILFSITLILCIFWFWHHMTDPLAITL